MSGLQKLLLVIILVAMVVGILVTWGSIGSATLTLGLLLALVLLAIRYVQRHRNPDDFNWEG